MIKDIYRLVDVITGYQPAAVVAAAVRLGVFEKLSPTEATAAGQLAADLGVSPDALARLLVALDAIGLVVAKPDGYVATGFAHRELGPDGDLRAVVEKEAFFARLWLDLDDTVRTGAARLDPWDVRLATDPGQVLGFLAGLDVLARRTGPPLASFDVLAPGRRVVDVGGGLGSYTRILAEAGSRVTLVDLPDVIGWARPRLADLVEAGSVELVAADVRSHPSCGVAPGSQDAALVSHLVHDLVRSTASRLLEAARRAVRPGGVVVVNDFAGDSGPGAFGPLFDLMMAVETGGAAYALSDLTGMLEQVGLVDVKVEPFDPPLTVIRGMVP